jgi:hypothetical protein
MRSTDAEMQYTPGARNNDAGGGRARQIEACDKEPQWGDKPVKSNCAQEAVGRDEQMLATVAEGSGPLRMNQPES